MSSPAMMCPPEADLKALLVGSLSEPKTDELSGHLENCIRCREALDRIAAGDDWQVQVAKHLSGHGGPENAAPLRAAERWKIPHRETAIARDNLERLEFLEPSDQPGVLGLLGPYEITETIGRGGFGLVLKGRDPRLNRIVAVKVLAPEWASNATARRRFLREAQAAAAVRHDHVVTIYAVDEVAKLPYLVMEFIPGKSLQERLDEQGPLEIREILRIGRQIAMGLAAAHAEGLIHRDIKPGNILLEDGIQRVKITDFGLARAVDDIGMTQTGTVAGTPEYMSPEQAWGGVVDHRTDLFSLGGVLYAMCTGRSPFRAKSAMAVLKRVCEDQPRPIEEVNPEIPISFVAIIERLLAKDPLERFASAQEVADLLGLELSILQNAETSHLTLEPRRVELPKPETPKVAWSSVAEGVKHAGGLGRRLWSQVRCKKPAPPPQESRAVRWYVILQIGVGLAFVIPMLFWVVLDTLEKRGRHYAPPVAVRGAYSGTTTVNPSLSRENSTWSPPLLETNELTLDITDAQVQISIDGRPYPVGVEGKRLIRLGDGDHKIAVADKERGWFDEVSVQIPTSDSYLRIDRGGILQSSVPTNVTVQWIPVDNNFSPLRLKGPDNVLLAPGFAGSGEPILAWDIKAGKSISLGYPFSAGFDESEFGASESGRRTLAITPNGHYLALAGLKGNEVGLFDVESPSSSNWLRQMTVTRHAKPFQAIEFSPDGRLLFCASENRAELFRLDDLVATKLGEMNIVSTLNGLNTGLWKSLFLPDSQHLLVTDVSGNLELWKTEPLQKENTFLNQEFGWSQIREMVADATGQRVLLIGSEKLSLFDLKQGKVLSELNWPGNKSLFVRNAAFLPDGRHVAFAVNDQSGWQSTALCIGDTKTGQITARLNFQEALRTNSTGVQFQDFRVSPDGRRIMSVCIGHSDATQPNHAIAVVNWVVPDDAFAGESETQGEARGNRFEVLKTTNMPADVPSLAITPDGEQFIAGSAPGSPSAAYKLSDGEIIHRLKSESEPPDAKAGLNSRVAVSPDGKRIVEAQGNNLRLWDRETGELQFAVDLIESSKVDNRTINRVAGISSVAFSPDGTHVVIACPTPTASEGGRVHPYGAAFAFLVEIHKDTAKIVKRYAHLYDVNTAIFLGDGQKIATASNDGRVRIWKRDGSKPELELRAGAKAILSLDATADGAYLATGSKDGTWHLWETRFGQKLNHWTGSSAVTAIEFLPEENHLLTAHESGHVTLWNLFSPIETARTEAKGSLTAMATSPDGRHLLTATKTRDANPAAVHVWAIPSVDKDQPAAGKNTRP